MGKRYQAILKFLEQKFVCFDLEHDRLEVLKYCVGVNGVILCTPTDTHAQWLNDLITIRCKKILCEKPIVKDPYELFEIYERAKEYEIDIKMMMQYIYPNLKGVGGASGEGESYYDYFRHGSDGIFWDCLQIIGLARGEVKLYESSPIWRCVINGAPLKIGQMDRAYIWFVGQWLRDLLKQEPKDIIEMHQKVYVMAQGGIGGSNQGSYRHSS